MSSNQFFEPHRSAYISSHSTETALLKVQDDILQAMDQKQGVLMVLLDLTAAFDTVSHEKLLTILKQRIGLCGAALQWLNSYLTGRSQFIRVKDSSSPAVTLTCGVPQGSVLGPLLFSVHTIPLGEIA